MGKIDSNGGEMSTPNHVAERVARLETTLPQLVRAVERIENKIDALSDTYVTHVEFWPVKAIVYTGAGAVLMAVLAAVIGLVIIAAK